MKHRLLIAPLLLLTVLVLSIPALGADYVISIVSDPPRALEENKIIVKDRRSVPARGIALYVTYSAEGFAAFVDTIGITSGTGEKDWTPRCEGGTVITAKWSTKDGMEEETILETLVEKEGIMHKFHRGVKAVGRIVWGPPFLILLIGTGVFLTFYLRFVQFRKFKHSFEVISGKFDDPAEQGDLSHFQALSSALSATIGIGNIAGVATAIHYGGPGALFWMWVTALVGMATKGTECYLAHRFRVIHPDGSASGGPMYYITRGLGSNWKWLGITFAFLAAFASLGSADMVQANTVSQIFQKDIRIPTYVTGLIMAIMVFIVIVGGIRRIGHVAAKLVPTMCALYMIAGIAVLILHYTRIPEIIALVFSKAFTPPGEIGGFAGSTFLLTLTWGAKRGLFSNEAGQGSAPIAHAAAKTRESVREGIVAQIGPFVDTIVVCSITGLVILTTDAWINGLDSDGNLLNGAALTAWAFKEGLSPVLPNGHFIVTLAVPLFAYSTMISWSYYGDRCVTFLWGRRALTPYRIVFVTFSFIGATLTLPLVWDMADVSNGLMAAPNLVALIGLAAFARKDYNDYFRRQSEWESKI